jgi:hypothetical protein
MGAPTTLVDTNERALGTVGNPIYTAGSAAAPEVATIIGNQVTYTDRSGTVTTGGTAQVLMALNASRRGFLVQNNSTGTLTINSVGTATTTAGIVIAPGQLYEAQETGVPTTAISILGATTGQRFDAREWN